MLLTGIMGKHMDQRCGCHSLDDGLHSSLLSFCIFALKASPQHPWQCVQAMEAEYQKLAERQGPVQVAKFQADIDREFAQSRLGLQTFPTIVLLPKATPGYIKYPSERRDADTLGMWLSTLTA